MWSNDPGRVNKGKGYKAVNWLDCSAAVWGVDGFYSSPEGGCEQQPLHLALRLILIVSRAAQYIVDGGQRNRQELYTDRYSFDRRGDLSYTDRLSDIPPEVADLN